MFDHPAPSITTAEGETGTDFITAPSGLTAAVTVYHEAIVRRRLGPVVGYARFAGGHSEPVYTDGTGLHRAHLSASDSRYDKDAAISVLA
jgi:hypothetical protein